MIYSRRSSATTEDQQPPASSPPTPEDLDKMFYDFVERYFGKSIDEIKIEIDEDDLRI